MNNLYHKVAVASVCTAMGLALGASEEAKAATFSFAPTITFEVLDYSYDGYSFDGLGDTVFSGNFDTVVRGTLGEAAEFAEFNIGGFSLAPNTIIRRAVFQAEIYSFLVTGLGVDDYTNPGNLGIFGYVGNGTVEASDFETGVFLSSVDISSSSPGDILSFNVTPFVNQRVSNGNAFAGFGIRALNFGGITLGGAHFPGIQPTLIIETEIVPEPMTMTGLALGIGVMASVRRRKGQKT